MKKTLAILLAMALLCMMAVGTTLSYFTDEAGDVNTMTVGAVKIKQNQAFSDNVALRPYIGEAVGSGTLSTSKNGLLDPAKNAIDKYVGVSNIGTEDAYIRTLFAFEALPGDTPADPPVDPVYNGTIHVNYNTAILAGTTNPVGTWARVSDQPITITKGEGVNAVTTTYFVYSFTYSKIYEKNTTAASSLYQIALDCGVGNEFFDQVGPKYDILVLSQAVQATGFTATADKSAAQVAFEAAFPITADELVEWFANVN